MSRVRAFIGAVNALFQREEKRDADATTATTFTPTNRVPGRDALPFTNVKREHASRAHSMDKELRRDLGAETLSGRQWKKRRKALRRELRDE